MKSFIKFLGTGGDALVVGKQIRASGGIILRFENTQIHLDPGPGALVKAKEFNINLRENTAIFISHAHLNHSNDLFCVISAMTNGGLDPKGILVCEDLRTIKECDLSVKNQREYKHSYVLNFLEKIIQANPEKNIRIENFEFQTIKTLHTIPSIGFKFFFNNIAIGYTADTEFSEEIAKQFRNCDILIINCKHLEEKEKGQMNLETAAKFLSISKPKLCLLTHFGIKMLEADPENIAKELSRKTNLKIIAAFDNLTVDLDKFIMPSFQKKIKDFLYQKNNA